MHAALILFGALLGAVVLVLAPALSALLIALPAAAALFSVKRCGRIPLYWVVAIASVLALSIAVLHAPTHRPLDDSVSSRIEHLKAVALSWPALACLLGSIAATWLSLVRHPLGQAVSGFSWGLLAMAICRQALSP